jgi:fructose-bisphosphate aldolase, class I
MKEFRLNRLFHPRSRRCLDVAVDHGFFNERSFLAGIENLERSIRILVDAGPDAIQCTIGQAALLQSIPGKHKPALVLRTDVANVYAPEPPRALFSRMIENAVEQAVRVDAACVVVNLFHVPSEAELADQCIQNIARLKPQCERFCVPLMIEPLAFHPRAEVGGYVVDRDPDKIIPLVRQAVELGADIIKADPTEDLSAYHEVIETAGRVPVLVRGGTKAPDREILGRTERLLKQGAAGIVYGRNIFQHRDPAGITRALMAIVHDGATADDSARLIKGG